MVFNNVWSIACDYNVRGWVCTLNESIYSSKMSDMFDYSAHLIDSPIWVVEVGLPLWQLGQLSRATHEIQVMVQSKNASTVLNNFGWEDNVSNEITESWVEWRIIEVLISPAFLWFIFHLLYILVHSSKDTSIYALNFQALGNLLHKY